MHMDKILKFQQNKDLHSSLIGSLVQIVPKDKQERMLTAEQMKDLIRLCKFPINCRMSLVYKASRDGFASADFHSKCKEYKNTLTIIQSINGNIFGGYTVQDWTPSNKYKEDSKAFIFIRKPLIIKCKDHKQAILSSLNYGPVFGFSEIKIADGSNENKSSSSNLGDCYDWDNITKNQTLLAGNFNFKVKDIEVFFVQFK